MIWLQQLCGEIEQTCSIHDRDWSRAFTIAHLLSEICDRYVPDAPKPMVERSPPGESTLEIGWMWRKVDRALTFYVSSAEFALSAIDKQVAGHVESPSDTEVSTFVRSFFDGYSPQ